MKTTEKWKNLSGNTFYQPITELVEEAIIREQSKGFRLKICVGSDSQKHSDYTEYATAVVVIREGKGAFSFIKNEMENYNIGIKERMLNEVTKSIEIAYKICDILNKYKVELEVHADINTDPNFKSNIALKDAMSYILGMGFTFKAKPDAYASSSCADKVL